MLMFTGDKTDRLLRYLSKRQLSQSEIEKRLHKSIHTFNHICYKMKYIEPIEITEDGAPVDMYTLSTKGLAYVTRKKSEGRSEFRNLIYGVIATVIGLLIYDLLPKALGQLLTVLQR